MILITGTNGFIGSRLKNFLNHKKRPSRGLTRNEINLENISNSLDNKNNIEIWKDIFKDINTVIHCAAKVHLMNKTKLDNLDLYRSINVNGTCRLAEKAVKSGVKRFIFLSTIKVNGEDTKDGNLFYSPDLIVSKKKLEDKNKNLIDPYTISKLEAEEELWKISKKTGLEIVIVRLPLVYGPGVKGNFSRLIKLIKHNLPLPLATINNRRSMISIDNLIDLLMNCVDHPDAKNKTFLVSDGQDLSTPDLLRLIADAMGKTLHLFPFPLTLLQIIGIVIGKSNEINRLTGSLQVDCNYTKEILDWSPPFDIEESIRRMFINK